MCIRDRCSETINPEELGVLAPKFGDRMLWHPGCFVCTCCKQLLVDLTYCVHDDLLYCERHYAEQLKPRCAACDEVSDGTTKSHYTLIITCFNIFCLIKRRRN